MTRAEDTNTTAFEPKPQFISEQEVTVLELGAKAPDFNLPGVDGKFHTLDEYEDADVLVIIFTCNHCPTAQAYEERMIEIVNDYQGKGVQLIAISPNNPLGLLYEELGYTDLNDDYEAMILRADYADYNFPYLYDGDTEEASLQYGPVATPHAYVFDSERKLTYQGRLDGNEKPGTGNAEDVRAAIDATLAGNPVETPTTKVFGCSTKWGWKNEYHKKVDAEWAAREVNLEMADVEKIQSVVKNSGGEKLRLINVWATWCGPCIIEYPEFLVLQRMYGARDFEFVSISADKPEEHDKALKFLEKQESGVTNYLFSLDDKYALIEAVDPDWNGALPYTLLVDTEGNKVWAHQGQVNFLELKRAIVEHPMMGRYY
ncbi:MAG: redoxin domain-containing protein [Saprospiraceae bacterium]|nr:redoxin domain-containing protein [Saprospiraceae bacterium]